MNGFRFAALALAIVAFWLGMGVLNPLPMLIPVDDETIGVAACPCEKSIEVDSSLLVTQSRSHYRWFPASHLWMPGTLIQGVDDWKPVRINGPPLPLT